MEIKINLEIGLSPALEGFLAKALGYDARPTTAAVRTGTAGAQTVDRTPDTSASAARVSDDTQETTRGESQGSANSDPQPEAQRRTRRTKAQMEADAAAATGQSGDQASTQAQSGSGSSNGQTAQASASPSEEDGDLAAALGLAENKSTPEGEITLAAVKALISKAVETSGNAAAVQAKMFAATGFKSAGQMEPKDYAGAHEFLGGYVAELEAAD